MRTYEKIVVLTSGGIDSTTALYYAMDLYKQSKFYALSILYGQKALRVGRPEC